ncbi:hypothetical protein M0Q50_03435 [bacterium]|jgi:hypothetical protein|nr:hypothetical protein [bacterium]
MRKGDILICKKHLVTYNGCQLEFVPGKKYEIEGFHRATRLINGKWQKEINDTHVLLIGSYEGKDKPIYSPSFFFLEKEIESSYVWDYFYTPEEIRLLKLKTL